MAGMSGDGIGDDQVLLGELVMRKFEETGVENVEWVWHVNPP